MTQSPGAPGFPRRPWERDLRSKPANLRKGYKLFGPSNVLMEVPTSRSRPPGGICAPAESLKPELSSIRWRAAKLPDLSHFRFRPAVGTYNIESNQGAIMRIGHCVLILAVCGSGSLALSAEAEKPAAARPAVTSLPKIPSELHNALQGRDFPAAIKLIDALVAEKGTADRDYLLYLKGMTQISQGQLDAALDTLTGLEKDFPKSDWLARSRFGRGTVLSKQRNYQAAAAIYKAEAERLLSNGRKDELTAIYLEFADRYFEGELEKGPSTRKQPDYNQALSFYQQALQLKPSLPVRQKVELRIARCHQELNQLPQAIEAYKNFLAAYSGRKTRDADRVPPALEVEAQFQMGRAQLAAGQPAEARKTWQDFLTSAAAKEAGGKLVAEATYNLAHTIGIPAPPTVGDLELGVAALEKFVN